MEGNWCNYNSGCPQGRCDIVFAQEVIVMWSPSKGTMCVCFLLVGTLCKSRLICLRYRPISGHFAFAKEASVSVNWCTYEWYRNVDVDTDDYIDECCWWWFWWRVWWWLWIIMKILALMLAMNMTIWSRWAERATMHCGDHRYLTKLYVSSVLVSTLYGRSSELGLSNLHLCSNSSYSSNWIGEGLWFTVKW